MKTEIRIAGNTLRLILIPETKADKRALYLIDQSKVENNTVTVETDPYHYEEEKIKNISITFEIK